MLEISLFSGKIYTSGKTFTRLLVVTVATNLNSDGGDNFFFFLSLSFFGGIWNWTVQNRRWWFLLFFLLFSCPYYLFWRELKVGGEDNFFIADSWRELNASVWDFFPYRFCLYHFLKGAGCGWLRSLISHLTSIIFPTNLFQMGSGWRKSLHHKQ